jgi:hypothetical protein
MAFPGDEGMNYSLNPGEAFAESYRVLVGDEQHRRRLRLADHRDPSFRPESGVSRRASRGRPPSVGRVDDDDDSRQVPSPKAHLVNAGRNAP